MIYLYKMDFKSILNNVCCDHRVKDGCVDLKNPEHIFALQEHLENAGYNIDEILEKTSVLFEKGRFPERQAYNKDGILVTFPTPEYKAKAIDKGTHFAENPKKANANIFSVPDSQNPTSPSATLPVATDAQPEKPQEPTGAIPVDTELKDKEVTEPKVDDRTPLEKKVDGQVVQSMLTGDPIQVPIVNEDIMWSISKNGSINYNVGNGKVINFKVSVV